MTADLQGQLLQQKRDNQMLRDALEKEQENSYKLLEDIHRSLTDNKMMKDQIEEKQREIRSLILERKKQAERQREVEIENDKLK